MKATGPERKILLDLGRDGLTRNDPEGSRTPVPVTVFTVRYAWTIQYNAIDGSKRQLKASIRSKSSWTNPSVALVHEAVRAQKRRLEENGCYQRG